MSSLNASEISMMFLSLGTLLIVSKFLGELSRRYGQPSVVGELAAGVILGPTILGTIAPEINSALFPLSGARSIVLDGISNISIVLFLLVAGLESDINAIRKQGGVVIKVGTASIIIPFLAGFVVSYYLPEYMGYSNGANLLSFSLFIATALSISALPVIAKTLMDLNYYRSDLGMVIIASAILNDIVGWMLFAVVISISGSASLHSIPVVYTLAFTILFTIFMITVMRKLVHKILPIVQANFSWPEGILAFSLSLTMIGAAITEWIGIHAIFGAFLVGVILGDTPHFREKVRAIIERFVSGFFSPIFFASVGLKVNFISNFDPFITFAILIVGVAGKLAGCKLGGKLAGLSKKESTAIGFAMNARGAMEIILGLVALKFGLIDETIFVALVVLALLTSMVSGPMMKKVLSLKKPIKFTDFMEPKNFLILKSTEDKYCAIAELSALLAKDSEIDYGELYYTVVEREEIMPTGVGSGVAIPHARSSTIKKAVVACGISYEGIDFGSPDGTLSNFIFLIVTPENDNVLQLEILADIAKSFKDSLIYEKVHTVRNYTELLSVIKSGSPI